jgi:hypothetical protein
MNNAPEFPLRLAIKSYLLVYQIHHEIYYSLQRLMVAILVLLDTSQDCVGT